MISSVTTSLQQILSSRNSGNYSVAAMEDGLVVYTDNNDTSVIPEEHMGFEIRKIEVLPNWFEPL